MSLHIRSTVIMFDLELQRIRNDTESLASRTRTLMRCQKFPENYDMIDLQASEQNLRDAADKIKRIREEIEDRQCAFELEAAE
jgi:hypothetical protein